MSEFLPEISFNAQYSATTDILSVINAVDKYYEQNIPPVNFSSGFQIDLPLFDMSRRAKVRESAAEALRAKVEAEQAQRQNEVQIAELTGSLRELDTLAEIASLKQQIANEQLQAVLTQLELGNGAGAGPGAPAQLSPKAEQLARIDERQKFRRCAGGGIRPEQSAAESASRPGPHGRLAQRTARKVDRNRKEAAQNSRNVRIEEMTMPLKTLLLNPPSFENFDGGASSRWPATREIESYWYPVWLTYPAGLLEGSRLLDAPPHHVSAAETIKICKEYEFLVLFTSTMGWDGDQRLAEAIKAANPSMHIAFVGPPVTTSPGEGAE